MANSYRDSLRIGLEKAIAAKELEITKTTESHLSKWLRANMPAYLQDAPNLVRAIVDQPGSIIRTVFDLGRAYEREPIAQPPPKPGDKPLTQYVLSDSAGACLIAYTEDDAEEQQVRRDWWLSHVWHVDDVKDVGWLNATRDLAKEARETWVRTRIKTVISAVHGNPLTLRAFRHMLGTNG